MSQWKVIDISMHNTVSDYDSISKSFDGIILKSGYHGYDTSGSLYKDKNFDDAYLALYKKTRIGIYFFSQARTYSEGVIEAEYVLTTLLRWKYSDFPIYVQSDYATSNKTGRADQLSVEERTQALLGFCETIENNNYKAGILCSNSWLKNNLDLDKLKGYSLWISNYSLDDRPDIGVTDNYDGWQYNNTGKVDNISGDVNLSYFYNNVAGFGTTDHRKIDLTNYQVVADNTNTYTYNGEYIEPDIRIAGLTKDVDYTLSFDNNKNAGTATVYAIGIGTYTGKASTTFTINKADISTKSMELETNIYSYDGTAKTPKATVNGLKENVDYKVSYYDNINIGTGHALVTGINNYVNYKVLDFSIGRKDLSSYHPAIPEWRYEWTGSEITPKVSITGLREGRDFSVAYSNNTELGTTKIDITGIGDYYGSTSISFLIVRRTIPDTLKLSETEFVYDGAAKMPKVTIDGLTEGTDYTVIYNNNIIPGTGRADAVGINHYTGTKSINFNIIKAPIDQYKFTLTNYEFTYNTFPICPEVNEIEGVREGYEYEISYENNVNATNSVSKAYVVFKGIGYYTGETKVEFNILPLTFIGNAELYCGDFDYNNRTYNPNNFCVRIKDDKHTVLTIYKDYIIDSKKARFLTNDTYQETTWKVTGIGNFKDSIEDSFITNIDGIVPHVPDEYSQPKKFDDNPTIHTLPTPQDDLYDDRHNIFNCGYLDEGGKSYKIDEDTGRYIEGELEFDFGDLDRDPEQEDRRGYIVLNPGDYDFNRQDVNLPIIESDNPEPTPEPPKDIEQTITLDPEDADPKTRTLVHLTNVNLYPRADSIVPNYEKLNGYFWVYNYQKSNNRIRLVDNTTFCKVPGQVLGWINISDIKESVGFSVGDMLLVNGTLTKNIDGAGNTITIRKRLMYITEIGDSSMYPTRCIGVSSAVNLPTIGFALITDIKKYTIQKDGGNSDSMAVEDYGEGEVE